MSPGEGTARRTRLAYSSSLVKLRWLRSNRPFRIFGLRNTRTPLSVHTGVECGQSTTSSQRSMTFADFTTDHLSAKELCTASAMMRVVRNIDRHIGREHRRSVCRSCGICLGSCGGSRRFPFASRQAGGARETSPLAEDPRIYSEAYPPYPSSFRSAVMAASSLEASTCCSRSVAASRCIFSSNGSPSSSAASVPT